MRNQIRAAFLDDDSNSLDIISNAIAGAFAHRHLEISLHKFTTGDALLSSLGEESFDLVFCDIEMPGLDGIEVSKRLRLLSPKSDIVFISNREDRVFDSLAVQPFGFVRKKNFFDDINLVVDAYVKKRGESTPDKIVLETSDGMLTLFIDEVIYFESQRKNQFIHLKGKEPLKVNLTFEKLEYAFEPFGFLLCYKGISVNYRYIKLIGTDNIYLLDSSQIPLARRKAQQVKEAYLNLIKDESPLIYKK